jgi:glutamyl-tRNA reductase
MENAGVITGVSVSHRNACVEEIETAAREDQRALASELLAFGGVSEAFALQTCNRVEAYVVTDDANRGREVLAAVAPDVREGAVAHMGHDESLRHLMRVAAGLESLVLGEDQILGQFRTAMEVARAVDGVGPLFEDALTKALHVGERARTETGINEGIVSLGSAAVELARRRVDLTSASALVVGAGKMGRLAARALADAGVDRLAVANRTVERAEELAAETDVEGRALGLDDLPAAANRADLIIAATGSPEYVLDREALGEAGEALVVDIARPRDVDPSAAEIADVDLRDIDALEAVTDETREHRREAAETVESMIDEELDRLLESFKRKRADEAIGAMYESAERVKARELDTAFSKLEAQGGLTDEQRETVEALADALVGQLLAAPTKSLREAAARDDWTTIQTAMQLFDPEFDAPSASARRTGPEGASETPADATNERVLEQLSND